MDKAKLIKMARQEQWLEIVREKIGTEDWLIICDLPAEGKADIAFYCALLPAERAEAALKAPEWDAHLGDFMPGVTNRRQGEDWVTVYEPRGGDGGTEALVIYRDYHGLKPQALELSEEFRLFHNLHHDGKGRYVSHTRSGNEEEVAFVDPRRVRVRLRYLKQFLAVKNMVLSLFWEATLKLPATLEELGLSETHEDARWNDVTARVNIVDERSLLGRGAGVFSMSRGKKIIRGDVAKPPEYGGPEPSETFHEFIIGVDKSGAPLKHTCDPSKLADYFGKNPKAPLFVTPVFFRKNVLQRYYSSPSIYTVDDGHITCAGLWMLRVDNDHKDHVVVMLGDLGEALAEDERAYWLSYNIPPAGGFSETAWKRGFEAEFADPQQPDLVFKQKYEEAGRKWETAKSWPIFLPLPAGDKHHLDALRVPTHEEQAEFDAQVLSLAKLLVDSINEKALANLGLSFEEGAKGISKLETYLKHIGHPGETHVKFLRALYGLRSSGAGHRKGSTYEKSASNFKIDELGYRESLAQILIRANDFLDFLIKVAEPPSRS